MNKIFYLIAPVVLFACKSENNEPSTRVTSLETTSESHEEISQESSISIKTDSASVSYQVKDNETTARYSAEFYLDPSAPYQDSANAFVEKKFRRISVGEKEIVKGTISDEHFIEKCAEGFIEIYKEYLTEAGEVVMPWESFCSNSLKDNENFVELDFNYYEYSGGAHGNGGQEVYHIDKKTGKELTLEEMFTDVKALTKIAEKHFRKTHIKDNPNRKDLNGNDFEFENNKFAVNDNFQLNSETISFVFNQYDIASYAAGTFDFDVPRKEVEHLIKEEYKK